VGATQIERFPQPLMQAYLALPSKAIDHPVGEHGGLRVTLAASHILQLHDHARPQVQIATILPKRTPGILASCRVATTLKLLGAVSMWAS
jgi:hypothetical protein